MKKVKAQAVAEVIARPAELGLLSLEGSADLVFADPPYNIGVEYRRPKEEDLLSPVEFRGRLREWISAMFEAARPGGVVAVLISEEWADFAGSLLSLHGRRIHRVIWWERFAQYNRKGLTKDHRHMFLHRRPGGRLTSNPNAIRITSVRMEMGDKRAAGPRIPGTVWEVSRLQGNAKSRVDWHPCQLPPDPLRRLVRGWTNPGDLVVDAFTGSGSLGLVAINNGRRFVGFEKEGWYAKKAETRINTEARWGSELEAKP